MTEAEWLAAEDPKSMVAFLVGKASLRKLRLFALGCNRKVVYGVDAWLDRAEAWCDGGLRLRPNEIDWLDHPIERIANRFIPSYYCDCTFRDFIVIGRPIG